jgi:uncharacterized membrane protein YfcA
VAGGFFSGLTGVGGGAIMVPLLTGLLKLPQHRAHGTSLTIVIFVGTAGMIGYWIAGNIDWGVVGWLAIGSMAGAYFGAAAMVHVPERQLRFIFGLFLLATAVRLFFA